jgi:hypothetical protein
MKTGHYFHKDTFGRLQSVLVGGGTWTMRLLRNTKIAAPHIAKNDVFTYSCQFNHDKVLQQNADDFHIHMMPVGAVTAGQVVAIDYAWGWVKAFDYFPDTLPNTGTKLIELADGDQYKKMIKAIVEDLPAPEGENYSSELFIECQRRNDGQDTYPGEFALMDGDSHYPTNQLGSYDVTTD